MKPTNNPIVTEIGKLLFEGNIIPHEWYGHIKLESGKTDLPAIIILAEIVYWYRPIKELDETTGKPKPPRQKFTGNMFESGAAYYENKFGLTKDQTRKALKRLEGMGYIRREYQNVIRNGVRYNNIMFVEPNPQKVAEITNYGNQILSSLSKENTLSPGGDTLSPGGDTLSPGGDTLSPGGDTFKTIKTTKTSTKTDDRQTSPQSKYVNCKNDASQSSVVLNTDNQSEKPQSQSDASITPNRSTDESSVALDISNLNWPKDLNQNQIVMKALTKLPDDQARQGVLDVVAKKLDNGTLQKPVSFLRKVVDNYLMGDFTPLEQISREVKGSSNKAADRQVYEPDECPYCDEQNLLTYEVIRTGEVQRISCRHYHDTPEIGEKRGLRYVSPQMGNESQFRSIGEILGSRVKDVDDVPF